MPSAKVLEQKKQIVSDIAGKLKDSKAGVVVDYKGISVTDDTKLRKQLREAGVDYFVVKNTLLRFAAKEVGFDAMDSVLEGTTALAVSKEDPIAAAKILAEYADKSKGAFKLKSGFLDGEVITADTVSELGHLPSKEQLLTQLLSVLNGNIRGLACALNAIAEKNAASVEA